MTSPPFGPAEAFAELGRIKLGEVGLDEVLGRVAEVARRTLPVPVEVSVTLVRDGAGYTAAYSGDMAREADEWQYAQGRGPCLDASVSGDVFSVPDLTVEDRWPDWASRARAAGVGSSLSIGLPIHEAVSGALNVYATTAHAFDEEAIAVAESFAAYAAVAVANAHLYDNTATLARQMQEAMASRAVIEQAKGIIIAERRCTPAEAFAILAKVSQDANRKVRDVAEALVKKAAGTTPG